MNKIALVQMTSMPDMEVNLKSSLAFIEEAAANNADLIAFPENFLFLGDMSLRASKAEFIPGPLVNIFQKEAKEKNISILMGSIYEKSKDYSDKVYNTSVLIDRNGDLVARYRKAHLFDITFGDVVIKESDLVLPGREVVFCKHEIGVLGFSICYDIRFPGLYRRLTMAGAQIVFVPAAFTVVTGKYHWLTLLKARAIENQVYIAAPAQIGRHNPNRESFGKTALIDPWGNIQIVAPDKEGLVFGEIDLKYLEKVRRRMPVREHRAQGIDLS